MDPLILSRIQFAANISFHILFPSITIALGWVLLFFKLRYTATGDSAWMRAYFTWVKVFALAFALGVVSGVTMSFQFGTNWPGYMAKVGNIAGPLLAYEILTAFFLEAVFLGIMLFGFRRVSNRVHTLATFLVAFGTTLSAFWILALNSWMQTPAGYEMRDGVAHVARLVGGDLQSVLPLPPHPHAACLGAHRLVLHRRPVGAAPSRRRPLGIDVEGAAHRGLHGRHPDPRADLRRRPARPQHAGAPAAEDRGDGGQLAAPAPTCRWCCSPFPTRRAGRTCSRSSIPNGASLVLTPQPRRRRCPPLTTIPATIRRSLPCSGAFASWSAPASLMLAVSWAAAWFLWRRHTLPRLVAYALVPMALSGWVALLAGWYTTEIGRQPWLVTGILKTADALGPVPGSHVALTLAVYLILYVLLMLAFLGVLVRLSLKAAKDGDSSPLPGVRDRALAQPVQAGE